jgi:hypothetical protein
MSIAGAEQIEVRAEAGLRYVDKMSTKLSAKPQTDTKNADFSIDSRAVRVRLFVAQQIFY